MTMPDGNSASELNFDSENSRVIRAREGFMGEALDDLVERVLSCEKRAAVDRDEFVVEEFDQREIIHAAMQDIEFRDRVEARLRAYLVDSDAVIERAEALAEDEGQ